ncbi:MAG: P-loop NTPase [Candidatus Eisenbacteria bacterium]|nr:P-loop NTPase [Candidatus Eisenbacteria bacterium]
MRVAVASGKGGTGKTTIATGLVLSARAAGRSTAYVDCDVEEPNGHIYLRPEIEAVTPSTTTVPVIDENSCTLCRACAETCRFNALAVAGRRVMTFPELCHACGACSLVCAAGAISEEPRETGLVRMGASDSVRFVDGRLTVGEAMPVPLLRDVIARAPDTSLTVFDAPPGTSCTVVETLSAVDRVLLVVEPTPFGLHDLSLAAELVADLGRPARVVINKDDGSGRGEAAAEEHGLEVVGSFLEERIIAEMCSRGEHPVRSDREYAAEMNRVQRALDEARVIGGR